MIRIEQGDITKLAEDAIVNAAHTKKKWRVVDEG